MNLHLHPDVTRLDFDALPEQHRKVAVRILVALRDDPHAIEASVVLRATRVALDLTGCRSLRFGGESYDDAFRIVFVVDGDDCLVLAIGERQGSKVFRTAQERLRPRPPVRPMRHHLMDARPGQLHKLAGLTGSPAAGISGEVGGSV